MDKGRNLIDEHFVNCPTLVEYVDYYHECKGVVKGDLNRKGLVEANLAMNILGRGRIEELFNKGVITPCRFMVNKDALVKKGYFFLEQNTNLDYGLVLEGPGLD